MADPARKDDLRAFFDAEWYLSKYPDVASAGVDPLEHFLNYGAAENRNPNRFFDSTWYLAQYKDVAEAGLHPLLHYLQHGAKEQRNPHPRFDSTFYVEEHPEAADNPLLFHILRGVRLGYETEKIIAIGDYLPSGTRPPSAHEGIVVDIVIPVYLGLEQTQRCLESIFADADRPPGQIIVIDDCSPEPALSRWLDVVNARGGIRLIRNRRNMGFVKSANRGMTISADADVVLLNSDTVVPGGWLARLSGHAYAAPRIGSVSPFSNNATICSYPADAGGPMPFGYDLETIDNACQYANGGRAVEVPTTVGFAMYIRRACLAEVGLFDADTFGRGYGEENDFCIRATTLGWRHLLACDTFVYHEGQVSFGLDSEDARGKFELLTARYPDFPEQVARHVRRDKVGPFRFALTAAVFAQSKLPTLLFVSHGLGGGVRQHLEQLIARVAEKARILLLRATPRGIALSVPAQPGHPELEFADERFDDLLCLLRFIGVARIHVHHILGMDFDIRGLIRELGVPFDFTAHDYFAICPQINLLPDRNGEYCGEPGPGTCNACIAERPDSGATDIVSWRNLHGWLLREVDRVICPSDDTRQRLLRYGLDDRGLVVPHEAAKGRNWPIKWPLAKTLAPKLPLRIALLGVLAPHKGAWRVQNVIERAEPAEFQFHLVGYVEDKLSRLATERLQQTGQYDAANLIALIEKVAPHLIWFPAQWPETYSYTLSAAIETGLPIVASDIGSFRERLAERPSVWMLPAPSSTSKWIDTFREVRRTLTDRDSARRPKPRKIVADFYEKEYTAPLSRPAILPGTLDLRRSDRKVVLAIPERIGNESISPCAHIRMLLPLNHPAVSEDLDASIVTAKEMLRYTADAVICQRHSATNVAEANAIVAHCHATGARLIYDLDDDLLDLPADHADAAELAPRAEAVARLIEGADAVWVSTPALRDKLGRYRKDAVVIPNGLDERIWRATEPPDRLPFGPLRLLFMGTATHDGDFAIVFPALERIHAELGALLHVDLIGVTNRELPAWINRVTLPPMATASYPGFVDWMTRHNTWHAGVAPLADTAFNRCKSSIKTIDYAALGLAVLASDMSVYRGSIADGEGGCLVENTDAAWYEALSRLTRDQQVLQRWRLGARRSFNAHSLLAQAESRRQAWTNALRAGHRKSSGRTPKSAVAA